MIIVKLTYNREYEQRANNIYFSILWDLEILGRLNWESTQLPNKIWLMPCSSTLKNPFAQESVHTTLKVSQGLIYILIICMDPAFTT